MKNFYAFLLFLMITGVGFGQVINDNFEDGNLSGWGQGTAFSWANSTTNPITGNRSLKHNASGSGTSFIGFNTSALDITNEDTSWQFNLANGDWDPSGGNKFWVYLTANEFNLSSNTVDGYAIGVNLTGTSDILTLWKVTNGSADGSVITSSLNWEPNDTVGIRVERTAAGNWELFVDTNGGFDNLVSEGTGTNTDYTANNFFGLSFTFTSSRAGLLWMDDVLVEAATTCTAPTTQASAYNTTSITTSTATLNWTSGNGDEVLVVVKEGSAVNADPINGTAYTDNTVFGSGDQLGGGNYVVQSGSTTNSVSVTGLTEATTYHVAVYEYNTTDTCYELTELTGSFTTVCSTPTDVSAFAATAGNTTIDLSWTNETCFDEILVVAKATSAVTVSPTGDGSAYTADAAFGSGTDLGTGEFAVYKGSGTSVTVTGLTNGTTYYFTVFVRKDTTWSAGVTDNATPDLNYCIPTPSSVDGDGITNVTIGTINNTTGAEFGNYGDYSAQSTDLNQGQTIAFNITFSTGYMYNTKIWIDYNNDGDFDDLDEEVYSGTSADANPTTLNGSFIIPLSASLGQHRLRIGSAEGEGFGGPVIPCYTDEYGSYEDYTINIIPASTDTEVQFTSASASISEGAGTYDLEFEITNENAILDTTFDVVLTTGDVLDIDSYTTQTVTFAGGTNANQIITITITDDAIFETDETLTFSIQSVEGGTNASVGLTDTFDLTITNNDAMPPIALPYNEDFSNCSTAEWFTFDVAGSSSWTCGSGEYTMNGFPNNDDIDWLISDFTIDFDLYSSVNIEVTTSEQYGNATNEAGEFELVYSTDYSGSGNPTTATWTPLNFDPNNTSTGSGTSSDDTSVVDASSISGVAYIAFIYNGNNSAGNVEEWNITNILIEEISTATTVDFVDTTGAVAEGDGTYDLEFSITNEDATNATIFEVVLLNTGTGSDADIDNYTTQLVTFPAGSSTNETVTLTITDDLLTETDETLVFEIQNISGGNNASIGANNTFTLTISASDSVTPIEGDIVISEIMYNSSGGDDEWIEIYNASGSDITLDSDWRLNYGGSSFDFSGTLITSGSYLTIALGSNGDGIFNNDNPFTPDISTIATPAATTNNSNNLVNSSATIEIIFDYSGSNVTIDNITYDDGSPWPTTPDGDGPSLELIDLTFDNSLAASWEASESNGGTPGLGYSVTYTFNGVWSPSNPNGVSTASDDIVITSGDAVISTSTNINSLTVNPGASITINTGITLTAATVTLESVSDSYSSLISDGTISGTINYERFVNTISSGSAGNDLISLPLMPIGLSFDTFIGQGTNATDIADNGTFYAFAPYNNASTEYENFLMAGTDILIKGKGYRVATDSGQLLTFSGTPDTGTVNIGINKPDMGTEWNLIGNPYPSYVEASSFLTANSDLLDASAVAIYAYNSGTYTGSAATTSNFTIINSATLSLPGENFNIAPGQGFFVASNAIGGDIEFRSDMRTTNGDDDYIVGRSSNESHFFKLDLIGSSVYSTSIFFNQNAGLGLNPGYDAAVYGEDSDDYPIYSHLVEDNTGRAMAIQTLGSDDISDITISLGINANQGEQLTFSIGESNLPNTVAVYLDDTVTNTSTLLSAGDYVFTPSANLNGTGRFYLRIGDSALSTPENTLYALNIFTNEVDKTIVINGQLVEATTVKIYDIQGRTVSTTTLLQDTNRSQKIDVSHLNAGVYVVHLVNGTQNKTQKVIIR